MPDYDVEKTQTPRDMRPYPGGAAQEVDRVMDAIRKEARGECNQAMVAGKESDPFDELFTYHPPTPEQVLKYAAINQAARNFAEVVRTCCPYSADYKDAIRKIREARMTANAAIALRGRSI